MLGLPDPPVSSAVHPSTPVAAAAAACVIIVTAAVVVPHDAFASSS